MQEPDAASLQIRLLEQLAAEVPAKMTPTPSVRREQTALEKKELQPECGLSFRTFKKPSSSISLIEQNKLHTIGPVYLNSLAMPTKDSGTERSDACTACSIVFCILEVKTPYLNHVAQVVHFPFSTRKNNTST